MTMANRPELTNVVNTLLTSVVSARKLFSAVIVFTDKGKTYDAIHGWEPLHPAQARRVVALAFMNIVSAWEFFIESTFIRYMAGARSPAGYQPQLRAGRCASLKHAGQLIKANMDFDFESNYLVWSSWSTVTNRAKLFFDHGRPFTSLSSVNVTHLKHAFIIRHRVAHASTKARSEFVKVAKLHTRTSTLRQGYDVGNLLLEKPALFRHSKERSYFEAYLDLFVDLANLIAP
jgi:hypothetical protein